MGEGGVWGGSEPLVGPRLRDGHRTLRLPVGDGGADVGGVEGRDVVAPRDVGLVVDRGRQRLLRRVDDVADGAVRVEARDGGQLAIDGVLV